MGPTRYKEYPVTRTPYGIEKSPGYLYSHSETCVNSLVAHYYDVDIVSGHPLIATF